MQTHNRMARFMIGHQLVGFLGAHSGFTLGTHHHLILGILKFGLSHHALVSAGGKQRAFIDEVHQIGTGEAGCTTGQNLEIDVRSQRHLAGMNTQNLFAAQHVRVWHHDLAVKTARTQQGGVKHIGAVGRRDDDNALILLEPVHLYEKLVQGLLALIIATAKTGPAMTTDRIDFIDEDNAGRVLLGLLEHVAHAAGANTHEHFDKVRSGNGEEGHIGLARHSACR